MDPAILRSLTINREYTRRKPWTCRLQAAASLSARLGDLNLVNRFIAVGSLSALGASRPEW